MSVPREEACRSTPPPSIPPPPPCPSLDASIEWDRVEWLRGEILSRERLIEHAADVARSHGEPRRRPTEGPLRPRFIRARTRIREAYAVIARDVAEGRESSPAEEWLIDNSHIVEDQLREIEEDLPRGFLLELPRLTSGAMRDFPRVYAPCLDYLRHTDGRVDLQILSDYVKSYQTVAPLTIGELWALPIMLRIGLVLIVGALASSENNARDRSRGRLAADAVIEGIAGTDTSRTVASVLTGLERGDDPVNSAFMVEFVRRLRAHDAIVGVVATWVASRCARDGTTPDELVRRELLRQAADRVSVGNAVTSMRAIASFDWHGFFESTSAVEAILGDDPARAYRDSDDATRDLYRHAVEALARRSGADERFVATTAVDLARSAAAKAPGVESIVTNPAESHVGYYLVDAGRAALEARVGYTPPLGERTRRILTRHASAFFLGSILVGTCALLASAARAWIGASVPPALVITMLMLAIIPASDIVISTLHGIVAVAWKPRLLMKLDFSKGIPDEHRTLVVVPTMLSDAATIETLLVDLEVRALANPDPNLAFALVTDFVDAPVEECEEDVRLLGIALDGIARLQSKYGARHRFLLFHRRRVWNASQQAFIGWERKRGKLEELNAMLRGVDDTTFSVISAGAGALLDIRYVITLDSDTELPRDVGQRLIGAMAHPLNRPVVDPSKQRVVRGHGIIQPRVGTRPPSSRRSHYARLTTGAAGIDPYTTAISDVYQDLFGEGSYVGKGIYDVDAFQAATAGRVPDDALLSHDLFEGLFTRSALATDIELLDEQPSTYAVQAARQHRWIRGDWQLLPWLAGRARDARGMLRANDLRAIDRWKIVDNLRRSLLSSCLVAMPLLACAGNEAFLASVAAAVGLVLAMPIVAHVLLTLARESSHPSTNVVRAALADVRTNLLQAGLRAALLLDQALVDLDAIVRTLDRLHRSHRRMLEWRTMAESVRGSRANPLGARPLLGASIALAAAATLARTDLAPTSMAFVGSLLVVWVIAPIATLWLGRPYAARDRRAELDTEDRRLLGRIARKTWRFFETFVTAEENHLPPDNFQEDPRGVVAGRTSPTNIGLYLLSIVSARDLGMLGLRDAIERLERTLRTVERLELWNGHVLNWYDTRTLRPLEPRYVSTVDSGNLGAYLWTLRQACHDLVDAPTIGPRSVEAVLDTLELARTAADGVPSGDPPFAESENGSFRAALRACRRDSDTSVAGLVRRLTTLDETLGALTERETRAIDPELVALARAMIAASLDEARVLLPFPGGDVPAPASFAAHPLLSEIDARLRAKLRKLDSPGAVSSGAAKAMGVCDELELGARRLLDARDLAAAGSYVDAVRERLVICRSACRSLEESIESIAERASALAESMDFRVLFDDERELFAIGYNVSAARLDSSHYDLLASEARLASLFCIAKGDAPESHWFRLGRQRTTANARNVLLSWSGSMFEYLMPLLVAGSPPGTLLHETCDSVVQAQIRYGRERRVPWGVSESAYNLMDLGMTYQYRAFGVPGLGLKSGLGEDLVIAPYATALAALIRPDLATENFRALTTEGAEGRYGYYEAIDYTTPRVPPGRRGVVVKCYMAHHQGMTLVALSDVLTGTKMQRRFHADPRIKATELLLEERVPTTATVVVPRATTMPARVLGDTALDSTEHVGLDDGTRAHVLGHGGLSLLVLSTGEGVTSWNGVDVNRFREDPALGAGGTYVYVRDLHDSRAWSVGHQPTRVRADFYEAEFSVDRVELHRRDRAIETTTEITASPEHAAEIRRVTLTNRGPRAASLDLTTYMELVLAPRAADVAHRAFSNLFVETEVFPERGALLARRRPRAATEPERWVVQALVPGVGNWSELDYNCSRPHFIGRGGSLEQPRALEAGAPLPRRVGMVLDPALSLRRGVRIAPGSRARASLITAMAHSRDEALALLEKFAAPHGIRRAFELAWADARVELRHLGITSIEVHRFQKLLSAVLFPDAGLREHVEPSNLHGRGRQALWSHGISGDLPILLVRVDDREGGELCRDLLKAHELWRLNGISTDLVILDEAPSGYTQPVQDAIHELLRGTAEEGMIDQRGGVFLRRADQMSDEDRTLLLHAARVALRTSRGSLARQLKRREGAAERQLEQRDAPSRREVEAPPLPRPGPARYTPDSATATAALPGRSETPPLAFPNGIGGFDGDDYVITVGPNQHTPAPWCNVLANPSFGTLVSESGVGCTWFGNSQLRRLTPWSNDAVLDPPSQSVYVRDESDGSCHSLTPRPAGGLSSYVVRHAAGVTTYEHSRGHLDHTLTVFVDASDPIQYMRIAITNRGRTERTLAVVGVVEWVLGPSRETTRASVVTEWDAALGALMATNPLGDGGDRRAFFAASAPVRSHTADREELFGIAGSRQSPEGLRTAHLSGRTGSGLDPCAALHVALTVAAGETRTFAFFLGEADGVEHARSLLRAASSSTGVPATSGFDRALARTTELWADLLGAITIHTPDPALDRLVNRWLLYQTIGCRLWARSGFYQSGGAYGFRDQLQDVMATLHARPGIARDHILRAAARQFEQGDVQHWWHPDTGQGVRTRCSDDMLWLPFVTAEYVRRTGDSSILDASVAFLEERELAPDEHDLFSVPATSGTQASLYEHCTRALDVGTTVGAHGLPTMRGGDWNDGMNRVGIEGRGESVWLAWFLARTLEDFAPLAEARADSVRVAWCHGHARRIAAAVEAHAWDGEWYHRAYFDDGTPIGSRTNAECQIDAIAQSWAVLAGVGDPTRARQALDRSESRLLRESDGMMLLLTPPFENAGPDPGYIRAYPAGVRENGGQYTHAALWTVQALARLGLGDRAMHLLSLVNPIHHGENEEQRERYTVEPYVVTADVYSASEHQGRGGWSWYTGSASWLYRIAIQDILGIVRDADTLSFEPCIPAAWPSFTVAYRHAMGTLHVTVLNRAGVECGVRSVHLDEQRVADGRIDLRAAPGVHHCVVTMGPRAE